jgi:hypothetical protein
MGKRLILSHSPRRDFRQQPNDERDRRKETRQQTEEKKQPVIPKRNDRLQEPPRGLEPWTYALRKHRSTN